MLLKTPLMKYIPFFILLLMHITVTSECYQYNWFIIIATFSDTNMTEDIIGSQRGMNDNLKRVSYWGCSAKDYYNFMDIFALLWCKNKQYTGRHLSKSFIIVTQSFCGNTQEQMGKRMPCTMRYLSCWEQLFI